MRNRLRAALCWCSNIAPLVAMALLLLTFVGCVVGSSITRSVTVDERTCVEVVAQPHHDSWYWVVDDQGRAWDRSYTRAPVVRAGDRFRVETKTDGLGNVTQRMLP